MKTYETLEQALKSNEYPGRGIVVGSDMQGNSFFVYFIMGRSENSRNRVFEKEDSALRIKPFDASRVQDPSLIVYYPVRRTDEYLIVTNGDQTDTVYEGLQKGTGFEAALQTRCFEPDAPHFTPRISALIDRKTGGYTLSVLKAQDAAGTLCQRQFFRFEKQPGVCRFIHTYEGDGAPLPSFKGEPEEYAVTEGFEAFAERIWNSLAPDNKISLYAECENRAFVLKNRHQGD